ITDVRRIIRLDVDGEVKLFYANLDLFVQLDSLHSGIHMSRFNDALEAVVEEVTKEPSRDIESLAERLVLQVVRRQKFPDLIAFLQGGEEHIRRAPKLSLEGLHFFEQCFKLTAIGFPELI
ncbi:GTP cyclohydrolase, FolE2/MptA family, partial [Acetomicrobium sp. S15 = DSM 107314]|uniref:GTP cyclohydrolase, FolE2/MptA family n=1 Tax=Acetomicrobium sp. S15 = DSM 107314 TaxID=2529858 RepID=UPI0018E18C87